MAFVQINMNYVRRVLQNTVKLQHLLLSRRRKSVKIPLKLLKLTKISKEELPKAAHSDVFNLLGKKSLLGASATNHIDPIPRRKIESLDDLLSNLSLSKRVQKVKNFESIEEYEQTHRKLLTLWASRIDLLNTIELVTLFKFIECDRKLPANLNGDMLEKSLAYLLDRFSIEDVGSICQSLFLCQYSIQSVELLDCLSSKLVDNLHNVSSRTVGAILKILRKSNVTLGKYSKKSLDLQSILSDYVHLWVLKPLAN